MRTIEWPERDAFLASIDELKDRHKVRHDSALAELAGISHTAISNWRNGKARPSATALQRIASAVDESPQPLLAAAGLVEGIGATTDPIGDLPSSLRRLIVIYRTSDQRVRDRIVEQAQLLVEWADVVGPDNSASKRQTS